ncbi:hypothetical protein EYC80_006971 [Monilinia laxa]|uniref:Anaphase-promoting complex subunit 4 WD40 domain-containing protein n=1 Tax=Monilinia laxa TaxID=61186 RepID=A0A5N6JZQ6_MONLA|nr:hypothetical protein EYC80_006971 [Monilinia laxa]
MFMIQPVGKLRRIDGGGHTARITSIDWNEAGTHTVSGSLDTNIFVWSLASPGKRVKAPNAHKDGVTGVRWIDGGKKIASSGQCFSGSVLSNVLMHIPSRNAIDFDAVRYQMKALFLRTKHQDRFY